MTGAERDALLGKNVPEPNFSNAGKEIACVAAMIQSGTILSAHDVSDGGIALALFEMTVPQRRRKQLIGADVQLDALPKNLRSDTLLFSQSGGFIVEVPQSNQRYFEAGCKRTEISPVLLGQTHSSATLQIARKKALLLEVNLAAAHTSWQKALYDAFHH
jgi:phosphoribosylformylglycinamidine synthase